MSRWLWALLGGVAVVAIAAFFWTASNQTNVTPPVSPKPAAVAPAPAPPAAARSPTNARRRPLPPHLRRKPRRHLRRRPCCRPQPRPPPRRPLPLARPRLRPSSRRSLRLLPLRSLRLPIRRRMQDRKRRRRLLSRRALAGPWLRPSSPRRLRLLQLPRSPNRRCRHPRPDGRRSKSRAYLRPRTSRSWSEPGPIPRGTAIGCSSGAAAAGPFANRWTSSPRPLLSSRRKKSFCLPPPAGLMARLERTARSR